MLLKWLRKNGTANLYTCGTGQEADFWMITDYVNLNTTFAEVIYVDVEAELIQCDNPLNTGKLPCYMNYFEVRIHLGEDKVFIATSIPPNIPLVEKQLYSIFSPLYNISNSTSPHETLTRSTQTFSFPQNNSQGVTFAIRSKGACGTIFRMKMYYYYCEEKFFKGTKFERTASPAKGFRNVTGECSEHAIPPINGTARFNRYCYENGNWSKLEDENLKCFCVEGHTPNKIDESCSSKLYRPEILIL